MRSIGRTAPQFFLVALCIQGYSCTDTPQELPTKAIVLQELHGDISRHTTSFEFAPLDLPFPAGVAATNDVVFVGSPFEGRVVALSRSQGTPLGELPSPPGGFVLPFILKHIAKNRIAVLDAGGFPSPLPLVPANPTIYEYDFRFSPHLGFSATLTRTVSFATVTVGFAENILLLDDGRYLLADALLGSIWIAEVDGTIRPGIVPRTSAHQDAIAQLSYCNTMPLIQVGGVPFLFTDSTLPGVATLAEHEGFLYFHSSCAGALWSIPLASLSDTRAPYARAADIRLVSPKPPNVVVEELLDAAFDPSNPTDRYLYAADALQLRLIRIDVRTGERQVVANDSRLFNFPSSLSFFPRMNHDGIASELVVVSNQQHRTPLTNDAITEDMLRLPFVATKVIMPNSRVP
jgi:hypothetical protein